jgi:hypothetical protein
MGYIARRGGRLTSAGIDANVRCSVCSVQRTISRSPRATCSSFARPTARSTIVRRTLSTVLRRRFRVAKTGSLDEATRLAGAQRVRVWRLYLRAAPGAS